MIEPTLIQSAQAGNRDALVAVLRMIETDLYRTAYYFFHNEHDARDATQDALIRIYTHLHTYENKAKFSTWAQRIVTNICIDKFRRMKNNVSIEEHDLDFHDEHSLENEVIASFTSDEIRRAINQLPEQYRAVIVLRHIQQFSYIEIAESLDLPLNTVKSYLFRARHRLQILLQDYVRAGGDK